MARSVRDVMDPAVVASDVATPIIEVAALMRENDVGDVVITDDDQVVGIVTDRDIVVRCVAEAIGPIQSVTAADVMSNDIATVAPDTDLDEAVRTMRERAIRRLPVVDGGSAVGVLSIGDLAIEKQPDSALADISSAPGNS